MTLMTSAFELRTRPDGGQIRSSGLGNSQIQLYIY